jgi:hypothetical protein
MTGKEMIDMVSILFGLFLGFGITGLIQYVREAVMP